MASAKDLKGKVVLLTGASSGIGAEAALAFARRGCRLALAARREDRLRHLEPQIQKLGGEAIVLATDVGNPDDCAQAVETTLRRWGKINILVNNAGINEYKPFAAQELSAMDSLVRTNLLGTLYMTRAVVPYMLANRDGHIINVSSLGGLQGLPGIAVYCATKFAIVGLTQALRIELRGRGVTLTAFCPGTVDTPMLAAAPMADESARRRLRPKTVSEVAVRLVRAAIDRPPEVIFGEVPGTVLKFARFTPRLTETVIHHLYKRYQPQAFEF